MPYKTRQHQTVLQWLEGRDDAAFTAAQLAEDLRRSGRPMGLATVYRQLDRMEAAGLLHKVPTREGAFYQRCPHPEADQGCCLLRCETCGRITHLDCAQLEDLRRHLETRHHFHIDPRRTVLTGRCQRCAGEEASHGTP